MEAYGNHGDNNGKTNQEAKDNFFVHHYQRSNWRRLSQNSEVTNKCCLSRCLECLPPTVIELPKNIDLVL